MDSTSLKRLERKLREHNEMDWVLVAQVMEEAGAQGYPATEDTAIDCIVQLHEQGKIRVGTYMPNAPEGFVPWEEPLLNLSNRLHVALAPKDPDDPAGPAMSTMIDFIDDPPTGE